MNWEDKSLACLLHLNHLVLCLAGRSPWQDKPFPLAWVFEVDETIREQNEKWWFDRCFSLQKLERPSQSV